MPCTVGVITGGADNAKPHLPAGLMGPILFGPIGNDRADTIPLHVLRWILDHFLHHHFGANTIPPNIQNGMNFAKPNRREPLIRVAKLHPINLSYYMPILPLWSYLLFDSLENDPLIRTNAVVENWNRILKRTTMKSATKLRPGDFIRNLYPNLSGRVSAFSLRFIPIANKLFSVRKQKRAIPDANECEEVWKKRKLNKKSCLKT